MKSPNIEPKVTDFSEISSSLQDYLFLLGRLKAQVNMHRSNHLRQIRFEQFTV